MNLKHDKSMHQTEIQILITTKLYSWEHI